MPANDEKLKATRRLRIFPLSGNKERSLDVLIPEVERAASLGANMYVEPFLGSGSLFLNIPEELFSTFALVEKNQQISSVWMMFQTMSFEQFSTALDDARKEFGDIKDPESYRVLRDSVNNFDNENQDSNNFDIISFRNWLLFGSCLSSKPRWNPKHEFNQSSGHRDFSKRCDRSWFDSISSRVSQSNIFRGSWADYLEFFETSSALIFLDPPYIARVQSSMGDWGEADLTALLNRAESSSARIILTDVETDFHRQILSNKWHKTEIRRMRSSGPNRLEENTGMIECMWTNF